MACVIGLSPFVFRQPSTVNHNEEPMSTEKSFEDLNRELEDTVRRLESGDLPLAEALALFERGTALAEQCNTLLDGAELHVRQLMGRPDGGLAAEPFEDGQSG
jgi:exodeoxyribonuclease VII small subunit